MKISDHTHARARQAMEARLTDAMDGRLSPEALQKLEQDVQHWPDLHEEARLLGIRFVAEVASKDDFGSSLRAAFPEKTPPRQRLSRISRVLQNNAIPAASSHQDEAGGFEQQVYRWFPAYVSAAALILLALLGFYSNVAEHDASFMDEDSLHEWIYATDVQQAFADEALLVDGSTYELLLPEENDTPVTEPPDEN
ncbi:MAG: hypothetical protein ACOC2C_03755 [Cyclonatronaceae bacterium]